MADIDANALASGTERTQGVANVNVNLSGVRLAGDDERGAEPSLLGHQLVQLLNLIVIALEDLEEGSLSTGGTLDTTEAQVIAGPLQVPQIHEQVLDPQARPLANRDELSRLSVRESETRQILVLPRECGQFIDDDGQLGDQDIETVAEEDEIGVVRAVARGGTPVDDARGSRGDLSVRVDVSHDIVSPALLLLCGNLEFLVLDCRMRLHLGNGVIGNRETKL